ncbi:hypothetical protein [Paraburkholderia sp. BL23I1N1]|uniref:hypothetical protein n=1 Tax=Paraburkholderia sp. BL23I1N1 TaxID=1938802 RepID=UPI0011C44FE1|nr:hypothetical protein [Paraburkholderia sp. BL23I1N1]
MFNSMIACQAHLARWDIPLESTLNYLLARRENDYSKVQDLIERPNETLTVLMRFAHALELGEVFDLDLWKLDGVVFAAYVNSVFLEYGEDMTSHGQNLSWAIPARRRRCTFEAAVSKGQRERAVTRGSTGGANETSGHYLVVPCLPHSKLRLDGYL